jgi:hypothetical protein
MKITTNGRELNDALNGIAGVGDSHSLALAQAFSALARCLDTQTGHDITLLADVLDDAVTVSIVTGKASSALAPDEPWENPHLAEIDRERQASRSEEDAAEAERIRAVLAANPEQS